jgi:hypothetical protein
MKINYLAFSLLALFFVTSCKKDIQLEIPSILTNPLQPGTLDTVKSVLVGSATLDSDAYNADSCQWQVLDVSNLEAPVISGGSGTEIRWVPQHEGDYRIIAKAFIGKNSVTTNAQIHVQNTPASIQRQMVGKWHGSVLFNTDPAYEVNIEFFSNGQYSAHKTSGANPAFYYGVDDDSPSKTYEIRSLNAAEANGKIVIYFWPGNTNIDDLRAIKLSNNNNNLNFEFWHNGQNGPFKYTLVRQ